jgi:hypothetical protein
MGHYYCNEHGDTPDDSCVACEFSVDWNTMQARIEALEAALRTIMNMGFESCREEHRIARAALMRSASDE